MAASLNDGPLVAAMTERQSQIGGSPALSAGARFVGDRPNKTVFHVEIGNPQPMRCPVVPGLRNCQGLQAGKPPSNPTHETADVLRAHF
ncbi:MAG: hypothetical protein H0T75_22670 [Rhizobiales bacterium]|nr:hypothetical protein [Hyphomicrobiales bacterium]